VPPGKLNGSCVELLALFIPDFIFPWQPGTFCNLNRLCAQTQQRSHLKSRTAEQQVLYRVLFCSAWFYSDFPPVPDPQAEIVY